MTIACRIRFAVAIGLLENFLQSRGWECDIVEEVAEAYYAERKLIVSEPELLTDLRRWQSLRQDKVPELERH